MSKEIPQEDIEAIQKELQRVRTHAPVIIEWVDSNVWHGQVDNEQTEFPYASMRTIGFVVQEKHNWVAVAQDIVYLQNGVVEHRNIISIPRECIKTISERG